MNEEKFWKRVHEKKSKFLVILENGRKRLYDSSLGLHTRGFGGNVRPFIEYENGSWDYANTRQIVKVKIMKNYQKS
jgi:hypothetical protein